MYASFEYNMFSHLFQPITKRFRNQRKSLFPIQKYFVQNKMSTNDVNRRVKIRKTKEKNIIEILFTWASDTNRIENR